MFPLLLAFTALVASSAPAVTPDLPSRIRLLTGEVSTGKNLPVSYEEISSSTHDNFTRKLIRFRSSAHTEVQAFLTIPSGKGKFPAMLCLHQTNAFGKEEAAGLAGKPQYAYALELAKNGFVTITPDYPSFGAYKITNAAEQIPTGGLARAIGDNMLAIDILRTLPMVDVKKIGVIGHSLGGLGAVFTAALDPRLSIIISSGGFSTFGLDDMKDMEWDRYLPLVGKIYKNDTKNFPFQMHELLASLYPRKVFLVLGTKDIEFSLKGVLETIQSSQNLLPKKYKKPWPQTFIYEGVHDFPEPARQAAYAFIRKQWNLQK